MEIVSVINYKGGVGKTTLTANLGAELASRGRRVLLIDFDPQISLTLSFYSADEWASRLRDSKTLKAWFDGTTRLADTVDTPDRAELALAKRGQLDIIASHFGLFEEDIRLVPQYSSGTTIPEKTKSRVRVMQSLARELRQPGFARYDLVLIDCPPNLSLATRIALTASDYVVSPARPDYLATIGLEYFFRYYGQVVDAHNQDIRNSGLGVAAWRPVHLGIVFTMIQFSSPDRPYGRQEQRMQVVRQSGLPIFDAALRYNNSLYGDAGEGGVPVALLESLHPQVAQDLDMLGTEFLKRLSNGEGKPL